MRPVPATPVRAATICAAVVPIEACDVANPPEPTGLLLTPTLPMVFDPAASAGRLATLPMFQVPLCVAATLCPDQFTASVGAVPMLKVGVAAKAGNAPPSVQVTPVPGATYQGASAEPAEPCVTVPPPLPENDVILLPLPSSMTTPSVIEPSGFFHCMCCSPGCTRARDHAGRTRRVEIARSCEIV